MKSLVFNNKISYFQKTNLLFYIFNALLLSCRA